MRKITYFAAIALAVVPVVARAQSADAVIDRAVRLTRVSTACAPSFGRRLRIRLPETTQTTSGVILRKKPNLLNITFESGDRVAADGTTLWVYLPSSTPGQVMRMPSSGADASNVDPADQFLNSPRTRFTVTSSGTATIGGRATHAVTLTPKRANNNLTSAKVWIDDSDSSIRQFDVESPNGLKRHVVITSFTANPTLSNSSFKFAVPKGAKIVDQMAGAY